MLGFQEIQSFLQVLNQRQFSPVNINTKLKEKCMRINKNNDDLREKSLIFEQILSTYSVRKCEGIS